MFRQPEKQGKPMKANNYDALLTYARLLSELQSGELEISWQKITPISKQDHLLTRQHLHRLILLCLLLMATAVPTSLLIFNEQQTIGMLLGIVGILLGGSVFPCNSNTENRTARCHPHLARANRHNAA